MPLRELLGLPDRFVVEVHGTESYEEFLGRLETDPRPELRDDGLQTGVTASLRFWRASSPVSDLTVIQQLFDIAQKAIPRLAIPTEPAPTPPQGDFTVVEVVVPLQDEDEPLSVAFDRGIRLVQGFQRAYHLVRRDPLTLITRQRLPFAIPVAIRRVCANTDEWPRHLDLMLVNTNVRPFSVVDLSAEEQVRLREVLATGSEGRLFASYVDLVRHARNAFTFEGDTRASVLFAATAAEVLLDDLLAHLLWEEGTRPENAAPVFDPSLVSRVRTQFHIRLGGSGWATDRAGALLTWQTDIASVRHRVVHSGYVPSDQEARRAIESILALERFVADRLATNRALGAFPRTAMALLGRDGLVKRGRWINKLERLADDPAEPPWLETFARWKGTMQRYRSEPPPGMQSPNAANAVVVAVTHPGRTLIWVLHDRRAQMACRADPPYDLTAEQLRALERARSEIPVDTSPTSFAMIGARAQPMHGFQWVAEYRLLPMAGVMVNRSDLDPIGDVDS